MFLRKSSLFLLALILFTFAACVFAQDQPAQKTDEKKPAKPAKAVVAPKGTPAKPATAEQVAESVILIYGFPGGRATLNQIRKTTFERGKTSVTAGDGHVDQVSYQRWVIRADSLDKERIRLDQDFPTAKYSMIFSDSKIFGVYDDRVFTPRDDASKSFENQIQRGLEALLRYKENGSTLALAGREKILGVDLYFIDVTDKEQRKTRFYISAKTFRVMSLEYEEAGVKYRRRFYDYNYAQGTLVPYRSVLWANDKVVEETNVSTVTFGQKVDEDLFKAG